MSFGAYPSYKDSGIDFLGDVPEKWAISRLGYESWMRARLGWKGLKADEYVEDGYAFLSTPNIKGREIDFVEVNFISQERYDESPEIKLRVGDVLLAKDGSTLGTVNIVRSLPRPSTVNSSIAVITPNDDLAGEYLFYLFQSAFMQHTIQRIKGGMGVPHLFQADLNKFGLPLPPLPEQTNIAAFLDQETGKIDALVEEQRRLIALLKEKRQAVISHAVTKGLNPDAPMKPSGIEWLGDVPEHWDHTRAGRFIRVLPGYAFPSSGFSHDESRTRLLRGVNIGVGEIRWNEVVYWERKDGDNLEPFEMSEGALVIGMDRPFIGAGMRVARLQKADLPCLLLQRVGKISTNEHLGRDYFHLLLQSEGLMHFVAPDMTGVSVPHISPGQLRNFPIPVPPVEEQRQIVAFVSNEAAKIDALVFEAETAITLLQERRSALISAAVTGKIDVRRVVAAETEAAQVA